MILLAELLDCLTQKGAFLRESEIDISISNLSANSIQKITEISNNLYWQSEIFDSAGTEWTSGEITTEFSPYRMLIHKPPNADGSLSLLTNSGLLYWLENGHVAKTWKIAKLRQRLVTHARILQPWGETESFIEKSHTKSPRSLVREYGPERLAPEDIRPWLLQEHDNLTFDDDASKIWANASTHALLTSIADEIDHVDKKIKFKGPPKLSISVPTKESDRTSEIDIALFFDLQRAASWVFESEREAELRHCLLANDIARSAGGKGDDFQCFMENIATSLDGAKIAYQVSLSELGRDTLKMLADLKKAVTEETAKVTEATRQLVTSIAGALAISLGLIAMRINATVGYGLITAVMMVVVAYVAVVIYSGYGFIQLQRQLRLDWQSRLYRFLPAVEYDAMVSQPSKKAECTFFKVALGGGVAVLFLAAMVISGWESKKKINENSVEKTTEIEQNTPQKNPSSNERKKILPESKDNPTTKESTPSNKEAATNKEISKQPIAAPKSAEDAN